MLKKIFAQNVYPFVLKKMVKLNYSSIPKRDERKDIINVIVAKFAGAFGAIIPRI